MSDVLITVALPSLIHRIGRTHTQWAREAALSHRCELKRVRRSRHWQLVGEHASLQQYKQCLIEQDAIIYQFVITKITQALAKVEPPLTIEQQLARLIEGNPAITLAELILATHCTEVQARRARFEHEPW
ncbi:ribosome recycling factor family protein [Vibrio renipiscarius]|uniref:Ribosome recycling factor n=1 Tax=Vibrio renipiscarius TaxID=1461322 RepID=A0A0C2JV44_9VIBR|nr:ribosome recycling factor family protein [Vibrio renipiscarius]KII75741.1 hypothetical protein PL18_18760 [Vibrio renipiscarius]KII81809.1 hypothetical protein OJ16_00975 [Vibrio renipiscarius]